MFYLLLDLSELRLSEQLKTYLVRESIEYQGHFEIISLSGAYAWTEYRGKVQVSTCLRKSPRKAIAAYVCNGRTPALMHCDVYRPLIETSHGYMFTRTDTHQNNGTASAPHMVSQAVAHQPSNGDYITSQADAQQNSLGTNTVGTYMTSQSSNHQNVAASEGTNDMVPEAGQAEDGAPQSSLPMETTIS
ncbi:hypothetical protein Droror1_Dr00007910 [Drosera rotundifolia]